ncbi:MAG: TonB-dependent receptor [bacterium]|nr:TonB-dependent receptor [bacterium]
MNKKFYSMVGVLLLAFIFTFTPLVAQEEGAEDVMDMDLEDLLDVEITTAGKQAEKISEIPASIVLVTRDDIEKYGYQTLEEVLESIPGLYQTNDYTSKCFGLRGFWTPDPLRNLVVLVNNVKQTNDAWGASLLEQINVPVEAIDRVDVVRGPMSVVYGTGAFFGVINIITNQIDEKPLNQLTVGFGSEKTKKLVARASGKSGDFQYVFNGSYYDTDGIDADMGSMLVDPAYLGAFGLASGHQTGGQLATEEKHFNFSGAFKGFTMDASYTESRKGTMPILPPVADDISLIVGKAARIYMGYTKEFSEKAKLTGTFGYFMNRQEYDFSMMMPDFYGVQNIQASGYQFELNLFLKPSDKFDLTLGVNYYKVQDAESSYDFPVWGLFNIHKWLDDGESIVTQAIFAQFNYKLSKKLKIVAGARVEQSPEFTWVWVEGSTNPANPTHSSTPTTYSHTKAEFIPRVALIWSLNDKNYVKLLYGKAITRPAFFQQVSNLGNPVTLLPETIDTLELNYIGTLSPKFQVNLSIFRNMLDKLIYRTLLIVDGQIQSYFANVGEMNTTGFELTLTTKPFENFLLELSGTYQKTDDARDGFGDIDPGYSPQFLGYIKASYFLNKDISLALTGNYVDKMEAYYDDTLAEPGRIGAQADSYFLLGANLRFRNLFKKGMFLNVKVSNLLDQEVRYPTTSGNTYYAYNGTIGQGLSFLATFGIKF